MGIAVFSCMQEKAPAKAPAKKTAAVQEKTPAKKAAAVQEKAPAKKGVEEKEGAQAQGKKGRGKKA